MTPYKNIDERKGYYKGYQRGYKRATIDHLGGKCALCGSKKQLEIHHKKPLNRDSRTVRDWKNLEELEARCKAHHPKEGGYK